MPMLASVLWWIVLGALLGWMGSWVFNRTLRTRVPAQGARVAGDATGRAPQALVPVDRVVEVPVERIVERVVEVPVERVVERTVERVVERTVVDTRALDVRDATIRALQGRVAHLAALADVLSGHVAAGAAAPAGPAGAATPAPPGLDLAAANAAGIVPRHPDDLEIVEGIGPRIAGLLRDEGIATWRALAASSPQRLRDVLALGGPGFRIADPGTWPEQAALAADGRWAELKALQDRLVAGRR